MKWDCIILELLFKMDSVTSVLENMVGLIMHRIDPIIPKGRIVLNVDVSGLDHVIPKGRIVLNVDVSGLDPVILKGRIV